MSESEKNGKKEKFLELLPKKNYHIGKVCKELKISRMTFYRWKEEDSGFAEDYEEACQFDIDDSEEKLKLLRQGVPEFKVVDGVNKFVGWIERPHYQALALHLSAKGKERGYGDSQITIKKDVDNLAKMTDEELALAIASAGNVVQDGKWDTSNDGHNEEE